MNVDLRMDRHRRCGWRQPGGLYLVSPGLAEPCGRLPIPLAVCPTCGGGVKPSRGWTWVNATALVAGRPCRTPAACGGCPLATDLGRAGLLWVGAGHYRMPAEFAAEAGRQGISRRVPGIPRGFVVGQTWVLLAHRLGVLCPDGNRLPGVFHLFRPAAIEYVVRPDDPPGRLEAMEARGATLVRVERWGGDVGVQGSILTGKEASI